MHTVLAPHSGGPLFRGSWLGLGLTLADLRNGGPESCIHVTAYHPSGRGRRYRDMVG